MARVRSPGRRRANGMKIAVRRARPDMRTLQTTLPRFTRFIALIFALILSGNLLAAEATVPDSVATADQVRGRVYTSTDGGSTLNRLRRNGEVKAGDRVITGRSSAVTLKFRDDTQLILGARTIINIDDFKYGQGEADDRMQTSIFSGIVRAVTGLIAKRRPASVAFSTPAATIGVRGTHFVTEVEGEQVTVVLLEQDDAAAPNAVDVSNNAGSVAIDQADFGTVVANANTAPTPARRMQVDTVDRLLRNVNAARRVIVPRIP